MHAIQNPTLCIMYSVIWDPSYVSGCPSWDGEFLELLKYSQIFHREFSALGDSTTSVTEKNCIIMEHSYEVFRKRGFFPKIIFISKFL